MWGGFRRDVVVLANKMAVLEADALVLVEDFWVESRGEDVAVADRVLVVLLLQRSLQCLEVHRRHAGARTTIDRWQILDDARPQWLREPTSGLPQHALEVLDYTGKRIQNQSALNASKYIACTK